MKTNFKSYFLLLISILIGVGISIFFIEKSKKYISTDFVRTKTIIETLKNNNINKEIIFFGSSVCMSAIDGKVLSSENKNVLNLGSYDQNLIESTCFYQDINQNTHSIFQCITIEDMIKNEVMLPEKAIKRLQYYNYELKNETIQLLKPISTNELKISFKNKILASRKIPIQSLRNVFRSFFKKGLRNTETIIKNELQSPYHYKNNVSKEKLDFFITSFGPKEKLETFIPSQIKIEILERSRYFFESNNQNYTIILMPKNPVIKNYTSEFYRNLKSKINNIKDINIIDLSTFLEKEDFIDLIHINKKGRDKITQKLKSFI